MVKLIIKNKLYDLTDYLEKHPGGEEIITDLENKKNATHTDATNDFYDIGHSDEAIELLKKYFVKDIEKTNNIKDIEKTDKYSKKKYFNNKCFNCLNCLINCLTTRYSNIMSFITKDK